MEIKISLHTRQRATERGTDADEISDVLLSGIAVLAKHGRLAKAKVYPFGKQRLGKYYEQKRVEVVYVVDEDVIYTVTVFVFYGKWEANDANSL